MRRVMVATPAHAGVVTVEYAHSLYHTGMLCAERGIQLAPVWLPGEALLERARNDLVRMAVEANVDDVLFIDADEEWEPRHALALLGHDVDVVGAAVRKKSDDESYNVKAANANIPIDLRTGLWVVESVGTGFLRLSRKALRALWDTSEPYRDAGREHRRVFEVAVMDGVFWSEDTIMCAKLKLAGFTVHLDPSFTISHVGAKKFTGDFRTWIAHLQAEQKAASAQRRA